MDETTYLDVKGMHCAACATRIEKAVSKLDGVTEINVNLATEKGRVTFNKNRTTLSDIINRINKIGFEAKKVIQNTAQSESEKRKEITVLKWNFIVSALLTFPLAWAMFAHFHFISFIKVPALFTYPLFQFALTIPIQFIIGFQFYERAWRALRSGSANMDVLVVLSTSAAFFYSHYLTFTSSNSTVLYYETSAFIITFILLGKLLEAKTKWSTTEAIKKLYQLQTKTATVYVEGKEYKSPVDHLLPGDIIILKPGEKVPIDGKVIEGNSMIDESLLTGESLPASKHLGSNVYAGTINQNGLLKFQVTKRDSETMLSQIIRIVEEAQGSKAPIQHIADKVTAIFVPIVIIIALFTFAAWYTTFQPGDFNEALEKVIAVLIVACPCALGLATPTSVMVGSGRAAQSGILFKEGGFLELLGRCKTVVLDKTGTLTKGVPQITDIYVEHLSRNAFLEIIGAAEIGSGHPVANAIVHEVKTKIHSLPKAHDVLSIPGYGVKATVYGKQVVIANPSYFQKNDQGLHSEADSLVAKLEAEGKTVMIAFIDSRFAGIIAVADELKTSSIVAVSQLKQLGLDVIMLSGDNRNSCKTAAKKAGIKKYQSEVTPQDKASIISQLQQNGNGVIMVGDGINDAPALAVADIGVAIGTGSDIAIESGDITIIKGDLTRLVDAITISKKTMKNIKQNLLWAFLYNIIMIPFAMLGFLAPWLAGAAMAISSVTVVLNSLRLK
ncbi:copper-translocating P-type ATPase [Virgibacillus phasianinus]|uniref:P-type Cu(+) transporter n=1 Tax=Virgibacillus phasianinus TaxID=2017483 RepID=A0A220U7U7_9BACI|nr:heavy metal translocating P-type ATPase [Virgibacillus phasianinus]ASK64052.1 copper-translocating P-type ATPase [Virgibacillus phasianinus]